MKIGLDIDGVIYDLLELHKNGIVNNEFWAQYRYDWTVEQQEEFKNKYFMDLSRTVNLKTGAKEIIELLKQDGHELIIITARGGWIKEMRNVMEEKFQKDELNFSKYYWAIQNKTEICKNEQIDIMIDDSPVICKEMVQNKVKTLYFRDVNREKLQENEYLKEVNNWGEIYRYIYNLSMEEKTK